MKDYESLVEHILSLTQNILRHHDNAELPHIVLHHLAQDECFGFKKAAYFVDNPDFDHFRGVAGYSKTESPRLEALAWEQPATFTALLKDASFLNGIRSITKQSFKRKSINIHNADEVQSLGKLLGMDKAEAISWQMKHGNFGVLLYESERQLSEKDKKLLSCAVPFLGFCPI